ncbi:MAG: hypothetical protein XE08_0220 [Parcubacteria bacterium 32_520]|nr:MAG: hypothetical protein XE08_0220 [Parcubacteria bacterium 32_520]
MEIKKSIPVESWVNLNWKIRTKLAIDLNVPKSSDVVLIDNKVLSDGRTQQDLNNSITVETLQEYTKSNNDDIFELFQKAVEKAEYEIYLEENPNLKEKVKEDEDNKNKINEKPNTGNTKTSTNRGRKKASEK